MRKRSRAVGQLCTLRADVAVSAVRSTEPNSPRVPLCAKRIHRKQASNLAAGPPTRQQQTT